MNANEAEVGKLTAVREAHEAVKLFPMMREDELRELADDVARQGLLQAIVLGVDGRVIDGRNRLEACRRAGVEPRYVTV
jgi:ParB-like chromosome segregation protein Spo0J